MSDEQIFPGMILQMAKMLERASKVGPSLSGPTQPVDLRREPGVMERAWTGASASLAELLHLGLLP